MSEMLRVWGPRLAAVLVSVFLSIAALPLVSSDEIGQAGPLGQIDEGSESGPFAQTVGQRPGGPGGSRWRTDFSRASVPLAEITSGGPPRDGIPPLDRPAFVSTADASAWLRPDEPVIALKLSGEAKAYPIQILIWHEIANDVVGGVPAAITFCPLCNTAIAFDRRFEGNVLDFGTSGSLYKSNLVMYDRQTESWWVQATGEAIVGTLTGRRLTPLPASMISFAEFKRDAPSGLILSRQTGYNRQYGSNPYPGYDNINSSPFLFRGPRDGRLPAMERVAAVNIESIDVAYPYSCLRRVAVVNDTIGTTPVAIFFRPDTASAFGGQNVGSAAVFLSRGVDGEPLSFTLEDDGIVDGQTGSAWNMLGEAIAGPLQGQSLQPVPHQDPFWFSWASFRPQTHIFSC